jgi:hypothetical protein
MFLPTLMLKSTCIDVETPASDFNPGRKDGGRDRPNRHDTEETQYDGQDGQPALQSIEKEKENENESLAQVLPHSAWASRQSAQERLHARDMEPGQTAFLAGSHVSDVARHVARFGEAYAHAHRHSHAWNGEALNTLSNESFPALHHTEPCHETTRTTEHVSAGESRRARGNNCSNFSGNNDSIASVNGTRALRASDDRRDAKGGEGSEGGEGEETITGGMLAGETAKVCCGLVRPHCDAGDVILFDARVMHFGLANRSEDVLRPLLFVNYHRPWFQDCQPGAEIIVRHR